eukprot:7384650-Prymnesium_polylepis.1
MDRQIITDAKQRLAARRRLGALAGRDSGAADDVETARPMGELLDELRASLSEEDLERLVPEHLKQAAFAEFARVTEERTVEHLVELQLVRPSVKTPWGVRLSETNQVESVVPGGPAEAAGAQIGDVVVQVDGLSVPSRGGTGVAAIKHRCSEGEVFELMLEMRRKTTELVRVEQPQQQRNDLDAEATPGKRTKAQRN